MQIVALLSWYEEDPAWLAAMVERLPLAGVDRLVALDGAYALYPGATPQSDPAQKQALAAACRTEAIALDLYTPNGVFKGNEVEKRSELFRLAEEVTGPDDWYLVIDADELITDIPSDLYLHERLAATDLDVATVTFDEERDPDRPTPSLWQRKDSYPIRILFRAIRGLRVKTNHWTYVTPDGRRLWGQNKRTLAPALDCTDLHILHRSDLRHEARRADQYAYYRIRDERKTEIGYCSRCTRKATKSMPSGYEPSPEGLTADWIDVCNRCAREVKQENDRILRRHGIDPTTMRPLIGAAL
jgi:hypothetical protein